MFFLILFFVIQYKILQVFENVLWKKKFLIYERGKKKEKKKVVRKTFIHNFVEFIYKIKKCQKKWRKKKKKSNSNYTTSLLLIFFFFFFFHHLWNFNCFSPILVHFTKDIYFPTQSLNTCCCFQTAANAIAAVAGLSWFLLHFFFLM